MTENKRFELIINESTQVDIIDWVETREKNAICIYNDLGIPPFSSAKAICALLNEQEERIEKLQRYNKSQELEIVRLHKLADAMSGVLKELGVYDVYDEEQINSVKEKLK